MIMPVDLRRLARARLADAQVLLHARRYDGAVYLAGYVVEIALKARVCRTLHWDGFPETAAEFRAFGSFRTHNLETLLSLSGREKFVTQRHLPEWSVVQSWDPETRYKAPGSVSKDNTESLVGAAMELLRVI